uniref:Uncharacterized protein n=1 Tax=Anguilla anguilla TaxID=7936 RepID=A0A0E9WZ95_ANGAN
MCLYQLCAETSYLLYEHASKFKCNTVRLPLSAYCHTLRVNFTHLQQQFISCTIYTLMHLLYSTVTL